MDGGHAAFLVAEEVTCILLPDELTYVDGALVACGFGAPACLLPPDQIGPCTVCVCVCVCGGGGAPLASCGSCHFDYSSLPGVAQQLHPAARGLQGLTSQHVQHCVPRQAVTVCRLLRQTLHVTSMQLMSRAIHPNRDGCIRPWC